MSLRFASAHAAIARHLRCLLERLATRLELPRRGTIPEPTVLIVGIRSAD
jgi:hypothetical protein